MSKSLLITTSLVVFFLGMGVGYALTPEYAMMRADRQAPMMELGQADRYLDLRYIDGMIAHHLSAIHMLEQAQQQTQRPEIKDLATAVIAADKAGIDQLYAYKKEWYNNTRQVTRYQKINLGSNDGKFELRLLNALLEHHAEAITVAQDVRTKSHRTEVLNVADEVISTLTANATQLKTWREAWYGIKSN
ncbi:MAG TPA: DUF305 domain-containing protein [Vitreimonas sp.]|nr:DUF305 domain-containing protein [Vitreimonas sp.]